ncbi:MAG: hypothetical protein ACKOA4_08820 [Haliscomenobacter sp.]
MISYRNSSGGGSFVGTLIALAFFVGLLAFLFFMARLAFRLLYFLGPILLIAAVIADHKVFLDYVNWLRRLFRKNFLQGALALVLSVVGYPIVSAFLLLRAFGRKKSAAYNRPSAGELTEFEELESKPRMPREVSRPQQGDDADLV